MVITDGWSLFYSLSDSNWRASTHNQPESLEEQERLQPSVITYHYHVAFSLFGLVKTGPHHTPLRVIAVLLEVAGLFVCCYCVSSKSHHSCSPLDLYAFGTAGDFSDSKLLNRQFAITNTEIFSLLCFP